MSENSATREKKCSIAACSSSTSSSFLLLCAGSRAQYFLLIIYFFLYYDVSALTSPIFFRFFLRLPVICYYTVITSTNQLIPSFFVLHNPKAGFFARTPVMRESKLSRGHENGFFLLSIISFFHFQFLPHRF